MDGTYADPIEAVEGHDEVDARVAAVQEQFAGMSFNVIGEVDAHYHVARIRWELSPSGAAPAVAGIDVLVLAEDGRIRDVYGFFGLRPAKSVTP